MCGEFRPVVKRGKLRLAVAPGEGGAQEHVAKFRVFGQDGAVAVAAEEVFVVHALGAVLSVLAVAAEHRAERLHARAEVGFAAVIFKADNDTAACALPAAELEVIYHALLGAAGV